MRTTLSALCAAFPGAGASEPFGEGIEVWKIGGKIFAVVAADDSGLIVKTPSTETAAMLIDAGVGQKAPYFHASWVRLPLNTDPGELRDRLAASYRLIRAALPARIAATLPPAPDSAA